MVLLEFSTDIIFDEKVQPVCLASNDGLQPDSDAWTAGWFDSPRPTLPEMNMTQLRVRNVRLAAEEVPTLYLSAEQRSFIVRVCWGVCVINIRQSPFKILSGAPLMKKIDERWLLHGMLQEDWYGYPGIFAISNAIKTRGSERFSAIYPSPLLLRLDRGNHWRRGAVPARAIWRDDSNHSFSHHISGYHYTCSCATGIVCNVLPCHRLWTHTHRATTKY